MEGTFKDKKKFSAELTNLYPIIIWVRERLLKFFKQKDIERIELATEEIIVNIIKHGYKNKRGSIEIDIFVNDHLHLTFKDKASKFNPLSIKHKLPDPKKIKPKKVGGLGLFLVFECVDDVLYKREKGCNILTLVKKRNVSY